MLPAGDSRMEWTLRLVGMGIDHQSPSQPNAASIPSVNPQAATYPTGPITIVMIPQISGRSPTHATTLGMWRGPPQVWGSGGNRLRMRVCIVGWVEFLPVA